MTKEEMKAKRRANRRIKRQEEHQQRMTEKHESICAQAAADDRKAIERLTKKNQYGKSDLTAYYGILNAERPEHLRVYGRLA